MLSSSFRSRSSEYTFSRRTLNRNSVFPYLATYATYCDLLNFTYRVLVGRPEGKRPLGRPRLRWEDNIKMGLREIGIDGANWIRLAQDRVQWRALVNTVMNLRVP
jgi:hypothetical protein